MADVIVARAPTRIDFGGGWTDVPPYSDEQGGCVCNLAIARYATVTLERNLHSSGPVAIDDQGMVREGASVEAIRLSHGESLATAALRRSGQRGALRLTLRSDFPHGAGLGGSSAVGVALMRAMSAARGETPTPSQLAERSRALEIEDLGIAGGKQDHYAAALGGALALRFGQSVDAERIELSTQLARELEQRCVVVYTGESRISGETITAVLDAYRSRVPRVANALARMRELATAMCDALRRGAVDDLAALVAEHWEHQRALHPKITTPTIERVITTARRAGALGAKALGASGGGCVLAIAGADAEAVRRAVSREGDLIPFTIDHDGARAEVRETERRSGAPA
jgi:D-glycero-alpha-D-manno-heptose-7-phosphate kinase